MFFISQLDCREWSPEKYVVVRAGLHFFLYWSRVGLDSWTVDRVWDICFWWRSVGYFSIEESIYDPIGVGSYCSKRIKCKLP